MGSWELSPGVNNVGSYQVSGKPYASASILCGPAGNQVQVISFPSVTRWVQIINKDTTNVVKVGFSELGVSGAAPSNCFTIGKGSADSPTQSERLELKVSQIWLSGSSNVDIVAGLTNIRPISVETVTGSNWSGSSGVG
jgi:hypothetical protein